MLFVRQDRAAFRVWSARAPIVHDYIIAALDRQKADLEHFITERLECPDAFPLDLARHTATIREAGRLKIVPRYLLLGCSIVIKSLEMPPR
jgi:hypothetical protein